jgi:hypothetical protein
VVLIQCRLERAVPLHFATHLCSCGAGCHQVVIIVILLLLLSPYSPCNDSKSDHECSSYNTHDDTDDCVLRLRGDSSRVSARVAAVEASSAGGARC